MAGLTGARAVAVATVMGIALLPAGVAGAEGSEMPGMCNGVKNAPSMVLNAHSNGGPEDVAKYILNLETDPQGAATGVLVVGRGSERLHVDEICRFWQHLPGMEPGGGGHEPGEGHEPGDGHEPGEGHVPGDETEGATIAHAVGVGSLRDGTQVLVRTDVRGTEEGSFFRVRFRPMGMHGGEDGHDVPPAEGEHELPPAEGDSGGHEDDAWTAIPAEGWAPLTLLKLRPLE